VNEALRLTICLVLSTVFAASSYHKLQRPRSFVMTVAEYHILPLGGSRFYALLLPPVELLCSILLVVGIAVRVVAAILLCLILTFLYAIIKNILRGRKLTCGCFGTDHKRLIGWTLVMEDALLALAAAALLRTDRTWFTLADWSLLRLVFPSIEGVPVGLAICVGISVGVWGYLFAQGEPPRTQGLTPEKRARQP